MEAEGNSNTLSRCSNTKTSLQERTGIMQNEVGAGLRTSLEKNATAVD